MALLPFPPDSVGAIAHQVLGTYFEAVLSYAPGVRQDEDPENLHQMRVNLRRFRSAQEVFAPVIRLPKAARSSPVAILTRPLGALRDLDVMGETLQALPPLPPGEQAALETLLATWGQQRQRAFKGVKKMLGGDRYQEFVTSVQTWLDHPQGQGLAAIAAGEILPDLLLPPLCHLWVHPGWATAHTLDSPAALSPKADRQLHDLRKQVKRVRYTLALVKDLTVFRTLYGDRLKADLKRLQTLQEALGHLQDTTVLQDYLTTLDPHWPQALPSLTAKLGAERHRAWQQWQSLQQHYSQAIHRRKLRAILGGQGKGEPQGFGSPT